MHNKQNYELRVLILFLCLISIYIPKISLITSTFAVIISIIIFRKMILFEHSIQKIKICFNFLLIFLILKPIYLLAHLFILSPNNITSSILLLIVSLINVAQGFLFVFLGYYLKLLDDKLFETVQTLRITLIIFGATNLIFNLFMLFFGLIGHFHDKLLISNNFMMLIKTGFKYFPIFLSISNLVLISVFIITLMIINRKSNQIKNNESDSNNNSLYQ